MTGRQSAVTGAVVLAGGKGMRLRPLTLGRAKQMLPIVDRPMIEHVVGKLADENVSDVLLSLGYLPDEFLAQYPDGRCAGATLSYATEPAPLGTAGGLRFAVSSLGGSSAFSRTFMVVNGDILTDASYDALLALHRDRPAAATILTIPVLDTSRFGSVLADEEGNVARFVEKPSGSEGAGGGWINAGVYVLEPSVLDLIGSDRPVSMEREVFPHLAREGALYALRSEDYWIDAGTPRSYLQSQLDLISGLRREVPAARSESSKVSTGAEVVESVIMRDAEVSEGAVVRRSVLLPGGRVCADAIVTDSVVGFGAVVGEGAEVSGGRLLADGEKVVAGG